MPSPARVAQEARAGVAIVEPDGVADLCCGTPWKSKGHTGGHATMSDRVLPSLLAASDGGRLPIVCDAASCTEGLETMAERARAAGPEYAALRFVDSVEFTSTTLLPALSVTAPPAMHILEVLEQATRVRDS